MYLAVAVLGGFSEYVRTSTANVAQHATLFQISFATDLVDFVCFLGVGLILYKLLKPVNASVALSMLVINAVSVAMQAMNMLNHAAALLVATDPNFSGGFSAAAFLELHRIGYLVAQIFFGLYLLPLGYLVYRSGFFPRVVGAVLMIGCAGYLTGVAASFASPGFKSDLATPAGMVGGIAELVFLLWLLVMGVKQQPRVAEIKGALEWTA